MTSPCASVADLGAYVLGRATLAEQRAVEAHVATCPSCRDALAELEPVAVLLDEAVLLGDVTPVVPVAPVVPLAPAVPIAAAARTPLPAARRRVPPAVAGLAAAVAAVVGLAGGIALGSRSGEPAGASVALVAPARGTGASAATGTAEIVRSATGAAVHLRLAGLPTDTSWFDCRWVTATYTASGGSFRAGPDGRADVRLHVATAAPPPGSGGGWRIEIVPYDSTGAAGAPVLVAQA